METSSKSNYGDQIKSLLEHINGANAIVVGAGSGLSASAGFRHYYERDETFLKYFSEFEKKYGYHSTFDGFYYRYRTSEERWAFLAKQLFCMLDAPTGEPYKHLHDLLADKEYHILTTNLDAQFERVFPAEKISAIQGDCRYFQCGHRCHDELYDSVQIVHSLNNAIARFFGG